MMRRSVILGREACQISRSVKYLFTYQRDHMSNTTTCQVCVRTSSADLIRIWNTFQDQLDILKSIPCIATACAGDKLVLIYSRAYNIADLF